MRLVARAALSQNLLDVEDGTEQISYVKCTGIRGKVYHPLVFVAQVADFSTPERATPVRQPLRDCTLPLVSILESASKGKPSLLAMVETIFASGASLWLSWKTNSIEHIVIASALAPFVLLRTPLSTRYTMYRLNTVEEKWRQGNASLDIWFWILPLIKILCSIRVLIRQPLASISNIPSNFYKHILVLDFFVPPQIVPGSEEISDRQSSTLSSSNIYQLPRINLRAGRRVNQYLEDVAKGDDPATGLYWYGHLTRQQNRFFWGTIFIILLTLMFRFSVKSTAIVWLPLLWIIAQSRPGERVLDRVYVQISQPYYKVVLIWSVIVMLAMIFKVGLLFAVWRFWQLERLGPLGVFTTRLVAPYDLPIWQVTSAVSAVLAWVWYFCAKRHLIAKDTTEAWPESWLKTQYVTFQVIRTILTLYTIFCTFVIGAATAWQMEWPPIHFILFPQFSMTPSSATATLVF
jgi:hypothetical protein